MSELTSKQRNDELSDTVFLDDYPVSIKSIVNCISDSAEDFAWVTVRFEKSIINDGCEQFNGLVTNVSFFCITGDFLIVRFRNNTHVMDYRKCKSASIKKGVNYKLR